MESLQKTNIISLFFGGGGYVVSIRYLRRNAASDPSKQKETGLFAFYNRGLQQGRLQY